LADAKHDQRLREYSIHLRVCSTDLHVAVAASAALWKGTGEGLPVPAVSR
jgi:hypothetical protein